MIECIFTIDYEIYGNGEGSLKELVHDPAEKLRSIFLKYNARFVLFVEIAELEMISEEKTDPAVDSVKRQIKEFYDEGFELGLHLHPQWYKGRYEKGKWLLDYDEYNLCTLPKERIEQIVDQSIGYFRKTLNDAVFSPLSFRAGNWLFQPTQPAATVLSDRGIKVDSSVFKGGLQRQHKLDYRRALNNGLYWKFKDKVEVPDARGELLELPIHTEMVPFWRMLNDKRVNLQQKGASISTNGYKKYYRYLDFLRFLYPLKLDFCRLTLAELTRMVDRAFQEDKRNPADFWPLVAIGHTKDLVDLETVEGFLSFLRKKEIPISTLKDFYNKCVSQTN